MPTSSSTSKSVVEAVTYSPKELRCLLAKYSLADRPLVDSKTHLTYFDEYFGTLKAKTIVVESPYTDGDFLDDYAAYYVRCLDKYRSRCVRLHFFRVAFTDSELRSAAMRRSVRLNERTLQKAYLGFIVVKPLPETIVGRTCLRTYPEGKRRHYPATRSYNVHLLGFKLTVESLAFQEQDTVAAACATSALWSVLQGTGVLFQHAITSPVEITKNATEHVRDATREFPNYGLYPVQMADAIRAAGLTPELIGVAEADTLRATVYGYLKAGIPILLNAALYDTSETDPDTGGPVLVGGHAVAVTGFRMGLAKPRPHPDTGTLLTSSKISKLYVHDDGVGPFARLTFGTPPITFTNQLLKDVGVLKDVSLTMGSSWPGMDGMHPENGEIGPVRFAPDALIVPLYHKIRVRFDTILGEVLSADRVIERIRTVVPNIISQRLEWEIFLATEGDMKSDIGRCSTLSPDQRWAILQTEFPRFIWRVIARDRGARVLEFLYDATDIEQGDFLADVVPHNQLLHDVLQHVLRDFKFLRHVQSILEAVSGLKHVRWLRGFHTDSAAL